MQKLNYSGPDRLIGGCKSWADFWLAAASLSEKQKGDVFERQVQLYLLTQPKYQTELSHVWLRLEVPADMNDEAIYGACFHQLSFKDAIHAEPPIISDYKILTYVVTDDEVAQTIRDNRLLTDSDADVEEQEADFVAAGIALRHAFQKHSIKHAISFHRSIRLASRFADQQQKFTNTGIFKQPVESFHISSKKSAGERANLLFEFEHSPCALMTNARCLTEGVDVPAIDCVLFADPKQSHIDIVQAAGRALRPYEGKQYGYIMLPIIVPTGMDFEEFAETTEFRHVASVITALSTQDGRIAEEFRLKEFGRVPSGKIIEIEGTIAVGAKIDLKVFSKAIETKLWERVGRANWRPFDEACSFVHTLKFKNHTEWLTYCRGEMPHLPPRPRDIPADPYGTYSDFTARGGWGAWLGTGAIAPSQRKHRPCDEAVKFVHPLKLKTGAEWLAYCDGERKDLPTKPSDIPANPSGVYSEFTARGGIGGWLGTGTIATQNRTFRPYDEAIKFVHPLKLKSFQEWRAYCRGERKDLPPKPTDIPQKPSRTYGEEFRMKGGWGGWLGTHTIATKDRKYRSYNDAIKFVHPLKLKNHIEWLAYCGGKREDLPALPDDIPVNPYEYYGKEFRERGGWGGWLGTGRIANRSRVFLTYDEAVKIVHPLKLKNQREWQAYNRGERKDLPPKPSNIPTNPYGHYGDEFREKGGWRGWLGTNSSGMD